MKKRLNLGQTKLHTDFKTQSEIIYIFIYKISNTLTPGSKIL